MSSFDEQLEELPERDREGVRGMLDRLLHDRAEAAALREAARARLLDEARSVVEWHRVAVESSGLDVNPWPLRRAAFAIALALLLGVLLALVPERAEAQSCPERSDALTLAILTVHEAGWVAEDDMRGIHAAIRSVAARAGVAFAEAACRHSGRALRGETDRAWAAGLDELGSRPARWPGLATRCRDGVCRVEEHAPWERYRERWLRTLELAAHVVGHADGTLVDCAPCTWGSESDVLTREARSSRTWVDVECGETRNRFGCWRGESREEER